MKKLLQSLGPGLLFAGAAIGVSHLVQSTRAGADFGYGLLWAIVLVHLFKYPFFQYGARYAAATGESLIDGYKHLGNVPLIAYYILTFATMFTIQAAVTIVTAGLAANLFGINFSPVVWSIIITAICVSILIVGKYSILDNLMKIIIITLTISTIVAVAMAYFSTDKSLSIVQILPEGSTEIAFLIAFLGWMPAPLDVSAWQSLWALEKQKTTVEDFNPKKAIFDFNVGFIATLFLGICFMLLGGLIMFNSGEQFSDKAGQFAQQLINLYTSSIGKELSIFVAIAAFVTMFSTTITTLDASPRAMERSSELIFKDKSTKLNYRFWLLVLAAGTIIILSYFISSMGQMIKIATILGFLTAPFYAIANFMLISSKHTPQKWRPSMAMKLLSYAGIVFLIGFSIWYLMNL